MYSQLIRCIIVLPIKVINRTVTNGHDRCSCHLNYSVRYVIILLFFDYLGTALHSVSYFVFMGVSFIYTQILNEKWIINQIVVEAGLSN